MSQKAKYAVEVEHVAQPLLEKTVQRIVEEMQAEIIHESQFKIYSETLPVRGLCIQLPDLMFPVDIYVNEDDRLTINGDEMDVARAGKIVRQFYKGVTIAETTGAQIEYNKEQKRVKLRMEVR